MQIVKPYKPVRPYCERRRSRKSSSPPLRRPLKNSSSPPLRGRCRRQRGVPYLITYLVAGGGPPLCHSLTSPPARRPLKKSHSPPLRGRCRRQRGGPHLKAYLVAGGGPPLCHSVTSPPARGERGIMSFQRSPQGGERGLGPTIGLQRLMTGLYVRQWEIMPST